MASLAGEAVREYNVTMGEAVQPRLSLARWWKRQGLGRLLAEYVEGPAEMAALMAQEGLA